MSLIFFLCSMEMIRVLPCGCGALQDEPSARSLQSMMLGSLLSLGSRAAFIIGGVKSKMKMEGSFFKKEKSPKALKQKTALSSPASFDLSWGL